MGRKKRYYFVTEGNKFALKELPLDRKRIYLGHRWINSKWKPVYDSLPK